MEAALPRVDSGISFRSPGSRQLVRGTLLHVSPGNMVFEVYSPYPICEIGDTLSDLRIMHGGREAYNGAACVRGLVGTGTTLIVSASLLDRWSPLDELTAARASSSELSRIVSTWGNRRPLRPDYQLAVSDLRTFLTEMSEWLAPLDVAASAASAADAEQLAAGAAEAILAAVHPRLNELFGRLEDAAANLPPEEAAAHRAFAQRELHPLVLCSPLMHRAYTKPMGYAGDYGTVDMILSNRMQGPTMYARLLDGYLLRADICEGHRNRIEELTEMLQREVRRAAGPDGRLRVLNLGCGPVDEICRFIRRDELAGRCDFTLLDFNQETIDYARRRLEAVCRETGRWPTIEFVNKSINDLLKEAIRGGRGAAPPRYDVTYCAGLFDYLSDRVCSRLLDLLYQWVVPGGLVLATNVHPRHRQHAILEDVVEWHLILRTDAEMLALAPAAAAVDASCATETAGVNVFLEFRRPEGLDEFGGQNTRRRHAAAGSLPGV
jgi:extracellular factor (EF) 3-hydroxypalmitic acid methyl ester biosynthesis protein